MRVVPAVAVKGRIARAVSEVRKPSNDRCCETAETGRRIACAFDTLIYFFSGAERLTNPEKRDREIDHQGRERAFLQ
jgi:hypothetical protein